MAEVLVRFREIVSTSRGERFVAQACGAPDAQGLWEGWIEFIPVDGGRPLRTPRETTQPNRRDAEYWATGLTTAYLEGALARASARPAPPVVPRPEPVFDRPAADRGAVVRPPRPAKEAIVNPFSLYGKSERLLRQELSALSPWHLVNIIEAYRLSDRSDSMLESMSRRELVAEIVEGVKRVARPR